MEDLIKHERRTIASERDTIQVGMFKSIYALNPNMGRDERFIKAISFSSDDIFDEAVAERRLQLVEYIKWLDEEEAHEIDELREKPLTRSQKRIIQYMRAGGCLWWLGGEQRFEMKGRTRCSSRPVRFLLRTCRLRWKAYANKVKRKRDICELQITEN